MGRKLVPKEVEIDPLIRASAYLTAQQVAVELSGFFDVPNRKCQMEWLELAHNVVF